MVSSQIVYKLLVWARIVESLNDLLEKWFLLIGCVCLLMCLEREVSVTNYEPGQDDVSQQVQPGCSVEVRGLVKTDTEVQYCDLNRFEGDFDMGTYE